MACMSPSQSRHGSQGGWLQEAPSSTGSTRHRRLTVFSGFVSYEQLEQKLLGGQKKGLPWLPKNVEGPHPVRMRGPGSYCAVLRCAVLCSKLSYVHSLCVQLAVVASTASAVMSEKLMLNQCLPQDRKEDRAKQGGVCDICHASL